jgi:hypothetical protein
MGGNALKNCETKRLPKEEYLALVERVIFDIQTVLQSGSFYRRVKNIKFYSTKEDFGDADILIDSFSLPGDWIKRLERCWNSKEVVPNGDVVSFEVDGFQVDVIKARSQEFDFAYSYFAYNDLGNLIGRMAKKLGLKYGHDGMWYVFRDGDQVVDTILVSHDPDVVYDLLALDKNKVHAGFDTLEDIFEFVASSPYFNPDIYLLENVNHIARVRDRKRKTYNAFLEWCKVDPRRFDPVFVFDPHKETYLPMLFSFFETEGFRTKWMLTLSKMLINRHNRDKFNGDIVARITGLTGKELGAFMSWFKDKMPDDFITVSQPGYIEEEIFEMFQFWKADSIDEMFDPSMCAAMQQKDK